MPATYNRELVRLWFGEPKQSFDLNTLLLKQNLTFAEVRRCGLIHNSAMQDRDETVVNLTKQIALYKDADEPVVLPSKIPLSKVLGGETKGLSKDAIEEATAMGARIAPPPRSSS